MGIGQYGDSAYLNKLESRAAGDIARKVAGSALGDRHLQSWQQIGEDIAGNALAFGVMSQFQARDFGDGEDESQDSSHQQPSAGTSYDPMNPLSLWNGQGGQNGLGYGLPTDGALYDSMNPLSQWNAQGGRDELAFEVQAQGALDDAPEVAALNDCHP